MSDQGCSDSDLSKRDIPSFIEPRPPLISNPFMRPRPQKGMNLLELFEEDSESEEPELVQVYLRLKPCNVRNNLYEVKSDRCLITSVDTATAGHGRRTQHNVSKMYTFSHIFGPESNQKQIFEHVVKENLKKLPDGHNFTLLTYGASGSGKTYTLMGTVASPGLVPRSLEYVFRVVDAAQQPLYKPAEGGADKLGYAEQAYELQWVKRLRHVSAPLRDKYRRMSAQLRNDLTVSTLDLSNRTRYYVWVSFVEIYNEAIYDLLTNNDRSKATSKLRIREDASGNVYVKGATQAFVRTGEEAYDVMVAGKHNLQVAATGVHAHSSRSHCIFTITMLTETDGGVRSSYVRLCDLAGSERALKTRNTGARMLESRAINSSLHVLERCLQMLRRKQRQRVDATLVPYRESKLTRLLGAGLSGARGEAVSMVVTLNPAPEYAHETRHVLQLAAVAKDIQVNQTIAESILESTQDTTVECSAEMMKLRSDNERLHFELIQAQTRNKELMAAMAEKQQEVAKTMFEIVEEAKDMTRQYYEARLQSLRTEMDEMQEEYEFRLKAAAASTEIRLSSDVGTPSRSLQIKVAQLTTEIAILKEQLAAEKLAQARAEEELHHLRACIEERDEKAEATSENDEVVLTDSDSEEEDIFNESLEPTFKKDDINQSRLLRKSLSIKIGDGTRHDFTSDSDNNTIEQGHGDNGDSALDRSGDTLKDVSREDVAALKGNISSKDKDASDDDVTGEISREINDKDDSVANDKNNVSCSKDVREEISLKVNNDEGVASDKYNDDNTNISNNGKDDISEKANKTQDRNESIKAGNSFMRGTYFVRDIDAPKTSIYENAIDVSKTKSRGTYFVKDSKDNDSGTNSRETYESTEENFADTESLNAEFPEKLIAGSAKAAHKHFSKLQISQDADASLAQFEKLEQDANKRDSNTVALNTTDEFAKILKEKGKYFDESTDVKATKEKKTYFDDINVPFETNTILTDSEKRNVLDDRSPSIVKEVAANNFEPNAIKKLLGESFTRQPETYTSVKKKPKSVDIFDGFESPNIVAKKATFEPPTIVNNPSFLETIEVPKTVIKAVEKFRENEMNPKEIQVLYVNTHAQSVCDTITTTEKKVDSVPPEKFVSIFENCIEKPTIPKTLEKVDVVESTRKSIQNMVINQKSDKKEKHMNIKIKVERPSIEDTSKESEPNNETQLVSNIKRENTIDEFENIYKDITAPRATEFELLLSQEINETQIKEIDQPVTEAEISHSPCNISPKQTEAETSLPTHYNLLQRRETTRPTPYNLRRKHGTSNNQEEANTESTEVIEENVKTTSDEVLLENIASCQRKNKAPKRNLRLRRRKNQSDEDATENDKLKDIVNLQNEFSDVTMDMPAPHKEVKDIESPEKKGEEENVPPYLGVQSCPSKSVQRSRRKLFTPRAEPLEESLTQTGDSNDKVYVPRPSYHRPRARRKL